VTAVSRIPGDTECGINERPANRLTHQRAYAGVARGHFAGSTATQGLRRAKRRETPTVACGHSRPADFDLGGSPALI
jgi:hypothetical protein